MHPDYLAEFLALAAVHFLVLIAPGPDFFITVRQSVRHGRNAAIATALGISAGMSVHVIYTLLGMGALMHSTPWLMQVAQLLGGLYLFYLGVVFIRQAGRMAEGTGPQPPGEAAAATGSALPLAGDVSLMMDEPAVTGREAAGGRANVMTLRQSFLQGFLTNATNPKATLFFLAVFTTMVSAETPLSVQVLYGIWMCLANAVWFVVVGLVFSSARVRGHFLRASCWIERAMGGLLIIFSRRGCCGSAP